MKLVACIILFRYKEMSFGMANLSINGTERFITSSVIVIPSSPYMRDWVLIHEYGGMY